ncbi:hypothetical protein [Cellulomonas triticagri]|uniref:hypothetical protein n=1 Tax=Cellulomonas triticagri TaxID=2483352 RepID=UPI0011C3B4CD|nr:hypothetical protein [Cellulomonas triticagri]
MSPARPHTGAEPDDIEPPPPIARPAATGGADGVRKAARVLGVGVGAARTAARRYLPVYRWAAELSDTTIAAAVVAGWGVWLLGGLLVVVARLPGSALVGAVLAVGLLAGDAALVSWWMGYRRAGARLRHEILARTQIAAGRELADSPLAGAQVAALGQQIRPTLAAGLASGVGVVRVPAAVGPSGTARPLRPGTLPDCPVFTSGPTAAAGRAVGRG